MKTKAVRLYDKMDLRLDEFELPDMKDDEILADIITDSLCMSTFKAISLGKDHKKIPNDIGDKPIILGHEFCGIIKAVGKKWKDKFSVGDKIVVQPNLGLKNGYAPGYSFRYIGGDSTSVIIPNIVMENECLLKYDGRSFFEGSLVEPLSCVIGAFNAQYHLQSVASYQHVMGIVEGGNLAILGSTGPMGFLAIDYAINGPKKPKNLVITGRTQEKLDLAKRLYPESMALEHGINIYYINTRDMKNMADEIKEMTGIMDGFNDVMIFAPSEELVTEGEKLLSYDGCLNFFSGPKDSEFSAKVNFYNVHYNATHFVGTSGGNTDDMREAIKMIESGRVSVGKIVTDVLGLSDVISSTKDLPNLNGGKKLVYTHKDFNRFTLNNSEGKIPEELFKILEKNDFAWSFEAENFVLDSFKDI